MVPDGSLKLYRWTKSGELTGATVTIKGGLLLPPYVAVRFAVPALTAVTMPLASTVSTLGLLDE